MMIGMQSIMLLEIKNSLNKNIKGLGIPSPLYYNMVI
jgi:hypothetical protein